MESTHIRPSKKPLALIVEDDNTSRITMGAALRKAGFEIEQAAHGESGIALFDKKKPDLIFLDVMMPGMDGFETCREIRKRPGGEYVQILMVTGLDDKKSIEEAFRAGCNDFVSKPINWTMFGHRAHYMLRAGEALKNLYLSRSFLAKTQEIAKIGNWQVDLQNNLCTISPEALHLLGFSGGPKEEITIKELLDTLIGMEQPGIFTTVEEAVRERKTFAVDFQKTFADTSTKYFHMYGEVLRTEAGTPEFLLGVVHDSTQMKQAEEEIRYLAFYDSLTGLANRTLFLNRLNSVLEHSKRKKQAFALLFMDIDQFKQINDTMGHHAGDFLLKNTADMIKQSIRRVDTAAIASAERPHTLVARHGGDEFVLILSDITSPESAAIAARRIIAAIPQKQVIDGQEVSVSASIGISVFPEDGQEADTLLKHADIAMYHAKKVGGNNYQFFKKSLNKAVVAKFALEQDIQSAIANKEFSLYFQPQLHFVNRGIMGAEALIRWNHPKKGFMPPNKFISVAEECGLIVDINKWVIEEACRQNQVWRDKGLPPVRIALNLSGYRLAEQNIVQTLEYNLKKYSLTGKTLEVEVTENVLIRDTEAIVETLHGIKKLGIKVALDDFGTGYSSLSYLTSFHVDVIKIDRSFVMYCSEKEQNRVIIKAIIAMGHSLGMKIVAEGIETEEQYRLLKEYGCDEYQGYYFSPPVPAMVFEKLL